MFTGEHVEIEETTPGELRREIKRFFRAVVGSNDELYKRLARVEDRLFSLEAGVRASALFVKVPPTGDSGIGSDSVTTHDPETQDIAKE